MEGAASAWPATRYMILAVVYTLSNEDPFTGLGPVLSYSNSSIEFEGYSGLYVDVRNDGAREKPLRLILKTSMSADTYYVASLAGTDAYTLGPGEEFARLGFSFSDLRDKEGNPTPDNVLSQIRYMQLTVGDNAAGSIHVDSIRLALDPIQAEGETEASNPPTGGNAVRNALIAALCMVTGVIGVFGWWSHSHKHTSRKGRDL